MKVIYKYLPVARLDVLRAMRIRISQPSTLNDPHDSLVAIRSRLEERAGDARYIDDDFKVERIYSMMQREHLSAEIGVISLTKNPLNTLMWTHYAEAHSGFCVHFDHEHQFFRRPVTIIEQPYGSRRVLEGISYPSKVKYAKARPVHYMEDGFLLDTLFQKSKPWSYEREYRSLMSLSDGQILPGSETHQWPVHLVRIPDDAIIGVTVGLAASEDVVSEVAIWASRRGIPSFSVRMEHLSYKLLHVPL